ncbi:tudor domain-containing protein 5 isoform X2 [Rhineura floridana]|uniref:tudor domain-containing protein 5 isoform X2 n=1 Tax=Rhineura floridana TaxID=261503 RepID=UPI002AC81777|nr:tudor domain-containing protein 5 isoform X2 [Rhineura floridana]
MSDQERLMNSLKKEMRSLLTPVKEGLTPCMLEKEYRAMIGEPLPFRALGYHSVMELVMNMPDVVDICPSGNGTSILKAIPDESTEKIASLVARQRNRSKLHLSRERSIFSFHPRSRFVLPQGPHISLPRRGRVHPTLPAVVKSELKELLSSSPVLLSDFNKAFIQRFGRKFDFLRYGFFSILEVLNAASDIITVVQTRAGSLLILKESPSLKKQPEKLPERKAVIPSNKTKQTLPTTLPAPAVKILSSTPALPMSNQSSPPSQESDTLVVLLKPVETPVVRTDERMKQLEKEMQIVLAQKGPGGTISSELKGKIKTIVAQHPEGLLISKLPGEFEVLFKETLPVRKLGFLNLMELVGALSDVLHIECKEGEQDWLIFDIDSQRLRDDEHADDEIAHPGSFAQEETPNAHELPCWNFPLEDSKNLETKFSAVTKMTPHLGMEEPHIIQEIMEVEIPPDAVQDRSLYSLPQLDSGALVGLFVEFIVSPSQFYVRIYSAETSEKLEDMMIEMRRCYSSKNVADRYIIPEASIHPGHLCCVRNSEDKWWYRVVIHQVLNYQEVEVFYPDFGNTGIAQKSSLRFLKYCYAKLPAQAIPCSLAWVKPTEGDWTLNAILEFQRLCGLKLLVGVVDEYIDGILYLFLCDTSSDEDVYLHNILRLEGHALICRENIPSKDLRELNLSTLYIKPSLEQQAGLTKADTTLLQQESLSDLPQITDSGPCKTKVLFQMFEDDDGKNFSPLGPEHLAQGDNFSDSSYRSCDFLEEGHLKKTQNSGLGQEKKMLQAKDTAGLCSDPEMPYLEPVYLCTEIWDENWMPSKYYEEKRNCDTCDDFCSDTAAFPHHSPSGEGSKSEAQLTQELAQQAKNTLGATPDSLSQRMEEFYISLVHSKQSAEASQLDFDLNKLSACSSQSLSSVSALHGEAPSERNVDDASKAQVITLYTASSRCHQETTGHNALMFTAELQGSPTFCVPCSPTVALGASARLATSGGYFSFSLKKMKT